MRNRSLSTIRIRGIIGCLLLATVFAGAMSPARAEEDLRVKTLMQEALRLYSEKQYVRALDLFRQVERLDPGNTLASDYIADSEKRIQEWEAQPDSPATSKTSPTWDSLLENKAPRPATDTLNNARDIIAARRSLVERMRNRSTNTDNIVQIQDSKRGIDITLFHDQLFLPGLQTLRDEALPILENVAQLIKSKGDRDITIRSVARSDSQDPFLLYPEIPATTADPMLPQTGREGTSFLFQDIEATRAFILFTYLAQRSMSPTGDKQSRAD